MSNPRAFLRDKVSAGALLGAMGDLSDAQAAEAMDDMSWDNSAIHGRLLPSSLPLGRISSFPNYGGAVTFIADDGATTDETLIRQIFSDRSVPCCCALISGTNPGEISTGAVATAQHLAMQNTYGWEMLCHSRDHVVLRGYAKGTVTFAGNLSAGNKITVGGIDYEAVAVITAPRQFVIGGSQLATMNAFALAVNGGTGGAAPDGNVAAYVATASEVILTAKARYTAGNAVTLAKTGTNLSVSGATLSGALSAADIVGNTTSATEKLRSLGFDVKHFVYPYGENDDIVRQAVSQRHGFAATVGGGVNRTPIQTFSALRVALGSAAGANNTLAYYKARVDEAKATHGWTIFMLHPGQSGDDATQRQYLADTIDYCIAQRVPILTVSQALEKFGNAYEAGDSIRSNPRAMVIPASGMPVVHRMRKALMVERGVSAPTIDIERDFTRFGVPAQQLTTATQPATTTTNIGRAAIHVYGTAASHRPWGGALDGARSAMQRIYNGTSGNNVTQVAGPTFFRDTIQRIWARFSGATFGYDVSQFNLFFGVSALPGAGTKVSGLVNIGGMWMSSANANLQLISRATTVGEQTLVDLGSGYAHSEASLMGGVWTVDLEPQRLRVWRGAALLGEITTNLPTTAGTLFQPLLQFDGPLTGVTGSYIVVRELEWGYNCDPWE